MAPGDNVSFGKSNFGPSASTRRSAEKRSEELSREAAKSSVAKNAPKISKKDEDAVVAALTNHKPDVVEISDAAPGAVQKPGDKSDPLSVPPKKFDPKSFRPDFKFGPDLY